MSLEKRLSFVTKPVSVQKEKIIPNPLGESQTIYVKEEMYEPSLEETIAERVKPDLSYFFDQNKKLRLESAPNQEYDAFPQNAAYQPNAMYPQNAMYPSNVTYPFYAAYPQNLMYQLSKNCPQSNENKIFVRNPCEEEYQAYSEGCQLAAYYGYQQGSNQENLQKALKENTNRFNSRIKTFELPALAEPVEEHENPEIRNVVDLVGDDYLKWNNVEPVFIDAPTGSGKTTFVYKKLIHDAIDNGHGMLIVNNRRVLGMQQKRQIYDFIKEKDVDLLKGLKKEEITDETYMIGPVCVTTYHSLKKRLMSEYPVNESLDIRSQLTDSEYELYCWSQTLRYAVFDEIHIFYADAEFNGFCHELLRYIPFAFRDAVRVYMTATSYEVFDYIKKYEAMKYSLRPTQSQERLPFWRNMLLMDEKYPRVFNWKEYEQNVEKPALTRLIRYTIKPDYSRYNLEFFYPERKKKEHDEGEISIDSKAISAINVLEKLKPSKNNKVIVFVDDKSVGEQICNSLKRNKVTAAVITSDKSKSKDVWKNIVENERFDESVLISTQVLDSGVNIKDKSVKNIMIFYTDRTQFIQSLGRKRLEEDEDNVTVRAYVPSQKSFSEKMRMYMNHAEFATDVYCTEGLLEYKNSYFTVYAKQYLTDEHYKLLKKSISNCECNKRGFNDINSNSDSLFRTYVEDNNRHKTLCYLDQKRNLRTNIYVLGVILGKIEYLKQFVHHDNNGKVKDYCEEVCEWLGKQNVIDEFKEKRKEQLNNLENELSNNVGKEMQDKEFEHIRGIITKTYIDYFPEGKLSGRTNDYINNVGKSVLNDLLKELGLDFAVNVERKNGNGKIKTQHTWTIKKKTDIPKTTEV